MPYDAMRRLQHLASVCKILKSTLCWPYYGHVSSPWIPGLYHIQGIDHIKMADNHMLNRKLLEKQRVHVELFCFLWGTHRSLFYNVNATVSSTNHISLSIFRFTKFLTGLINWQTDKTNCFRAHARGVTMRSLALLQHWSQFGFLSRTDVLKSYVWWT